MNHGSDYQENLNHKDKLQSCSLDASLDKEIELSKVYYQALN